MTRRTGPIIGSLSYTPVGRLAPRLCCLDGDLNSSKGAKRSVDGNNLPGNECGVVADEPP